MFRSMRSFSSICFLKHTRIGFFYHLFAIVNSNQVLLKDVVIKHVLRSLPKIEYPLTKRGRLYAISHILCIDRTGCMIVPANTADAAGDEVGITRVLSLHEYAISSKNRRGTMAFRDFSVFEVYLSI